MTRSREDEEWELQQDREFGDGPEPGDQFGSAPVPVHRLDEPPTRPEKRTEADRRAKQDTLKVRLPLGYRARLQALAEEDGYSVAEWISLQVDHAEESRRAILVARR